MFNLIAITPISAANIYRVANTAGLVQETDFTDDTQTSPVSTEGPLFRMYFWQDNKSIHTTEDN